MNEENGYSSELEGSLSETYDSFYKLYNKLKEQHSVIIQGLIDKTISRFNCKFL